MPFPVFIPLKYDSRYSLLGAMARQVAEAFAGCGCPINPPGDPGEIIASQGGRGLLMFFNFGEFGPTWMDLARDGWRRGRHLSVVHYFVDHPLGLNPAFLDQWRDVRSYRLVLPCPDGLHWLGLQWPWLRHAPCPHGIPASALCDERTIGAEREFEVVLAGSIQTEQEIEALGAGLSPEIRACGREMAHLLTAQAWTGFDQALDLVLGQRGIIPGRFDAAHHLWKYATAIVNRARRVSLAKAMQGRRTAIFGGPAWREVADGTLSYMGDVPYADLPGALARGRVCLAWGPTQFVHGYSERILLGMAAGCACVADDRMLVRRDFGSDGGTVRLFDGASPEGAREAVEALFKDPGALEACARRGRALVAGHHLWMHRLRTIAAIAEDTLQAAA